MAECSQKFKDMMTSFYAEAYEDGKFQCELTDPSLEKEAAILQYVAKLESYVLESAQVAHKAQDMTGGMP